MTGVCAKSGCCVSILGSVFVDLADWRLVDDACDSLVDERYRLLDLWRRREIGSVASDSLDRSDDTVDERCIMWVGVSGVLAEVARNVEL